MVVSCRRRKLLKALAGYGHEIRDAGQIPVRVGHLGMADVGRKCGHGVADIGSVLMPTLDATADERVAQIMYSRLSVGTTSNPPEFASQPLKHPMDGSSWQPPAG